MIKNVMLCSDMTAIILIGGRSVRMGIEKALLRIGGEPLLEKTIRLLQTLFSEVIVVGDGKQLLADRFCSVRMIEDSVKEIGPIAGIYTGLLNMRTERGFFTACDLPFLEATLISEMCAMADRADVVVPTNGSLIEPLHAIYSENCLAAFEQQIAAGNYKISVALRKLKTIYLTIEPPEKYRKIFFNINRPEDLLKANRIRDKG